MVRQPDIRTVAAKLRDLVGHQKSLNIAAELFGFKNWAHAEQAGFAVQTQPTQPDVPSAAPAITVDLDPVFESLNWVANNYKTTLAGKPVRDADECLVNAELLLKKHRAGEPPRFMLESAFTFITETSATYDLAEAPSWVELTIDQEFMDHVQRLHLVCKSNRLSEASINWGADNWQPDRDGEDFRMSGEKLVVGDSAFRFSGYPKHCDYDVQTRDIGLDGFIAAVKAHIAGDLTSDWTAYKFVAGVLLYSGSGDTLSCSANSKTTAPCRHPTRTTARKPKAHRLSTRSA